MTAAAKLDCRPLTLPLNVRLSDSDIRRIAPVQDVLLRPLDYPDIDAWRNATMRSLIRATGGDAAMFQLDAPGVVSHCSEHLDPAPLDAYASEYMPEFSRTKRLYRRAVRLVAGNRFTLWRDHLDWFYDSDYFNELVVKLRAFDVIWVAAPTMSTRFPAMLHTYHDSRRARHFDAADVQLMRLLGPALDSGVRTVLRSLAGSAALTASLDEQPGGTLVFDSSGRLLHRNRMFASLVATRDDERLIARAGEAMARGIFAPVPADLVRPDAVSRTVATRAGRFQLHAARMPEGMFALGATVLVTVTAAAAPLLDRTAVRNRYGLTRRQAEVALLLTDRKTNDEIADALCVSPHTARHHTEAVMGKLGARSRREVARIVRCAESSTGGVART